MIITKSISRFARNTLTVLETVRELKSLGIDVYFEKENIHSMSEEGELMLTFLASFAQEESLSVSENCKWRIRKRFQDGELANLRFMFGYKISNDNIEVDENNAQVVRWIFDWYTSGTGCTKIAEMLKGLNISTLRGGKWTAGSVRNILLNEKYTGNALLQKKFVSDHLTKTQRRNHGELPMYYAEGTHIPIVDKAIFDKASKILEENRKKAKTSRNTPQKYPFTGKIKCLNCGKNYKRRVSKGKVYWACSTYVEEGRNACDSRQIPEEILKEMISNMLQIPCFDEQFFCQKIKLIEISDYKKLNFCMSNGTKVTEEWQHKSRSESWNEAKRQAAREKTLERMKNKC